MVGGFLFLSTFPSLSAFEETHKMELLPECEVANQQSLSIANMSVLNNSSFL
jgi:hypothetical protein